MTLAGSAPDSLPQAIFVAGAPGSGKSVLAPVALFGVDAFNADDHAAALNQGSYIAIPQHIRSAVNVALEHFVTEHIDNRLSFAVETTLRSTIALEQARAAREAGFYVSMLYVSTSSPDINVRRVAIRARGGGHSAPVATLLEIRARSYANLNAAIASIGTALDELDVFDNSVDGRSMVRAFRLTASPGEGLQIEQHEPPEYLLPYLQAATARSR